MSARVALAIVLWPFQQILALLVWTGRFLWYLFICSNPFTLALWIMSHVAQHEEEEDEE